MNKWTLYPIGKAIKFNPPESLKSGMIAKKIPMGALTEFQRKINSYEDAMYSSGPKFRNGDTLLAKITPCLENGKTAQCDILEKNEIAFGSSEFIVLRATGHTDSDFIYYLAISPTFRKRAISCMEGTSGRKRVNEGVLKYFELPFPDVSEQKRIAKVLKSLDAKIELNNRINAELEAVAKTLYDYWFVQFDFPNEQGKPYKASGGKMVYNQELKREIPEGWGMKKLAEIANTGSGGTPLSTNKEYYLDGDIPWINSGELNNPFIVTAEKFITTDGLNNSSAKLFSKGSILVAMYGATAGKVSFIDIEASTNQAICAVLPNETNSRYFIKFGLELLYNYLVNLSSGSARDNLSQDKIRELYFPFPKPALMDSFDEIVHPFFLKILINLKENQQLISLRDWLLPMLMNGQVMIKEAVEKLGKTPGRC